jgi:esterase/lipase superfamily enzyme
MDFPIRWTRNFMRADAEQPTGMFRLLLEDLRRNQWVLLDLRTEQKDRFYPFKKGELSHRLEGKPPEVPVASALHLQNRPASQTVYSPKVKLFTSALDNQEEPWLPRKVLLDPQGVPLAIGAPSISGTGVASTTKYKKVVEAVAVEEARHEPDSMGYITDAKPDVPLQYSIVRIFYATDRERLPAGGGYTAARSRDERLSLGTCDVTIPRDHRMAVLESPRWWKFDFRKNPRKHITLHQVSELPTSEFYSLMRKSVSEDPGRSVLVFIHGFCVSFEDAVRRTAQLSYDLGFTGAPVLYSWPSAGSMTGYLADETSVEWTKPHLADFLHQVANATGASRIHVVAHSMGNRALVKILDSAGSNAQPIYNQIVLTAPDIDTGEFLQLVARVGRAAERVTLYASSNDRAISISKTIHTYPRAGESGADIVVMSGLDTVDASSVDTSFLGHSYYAEKRTVLSDLFYLLRAGMPPSGRHGLVRKSCTKGEYWAFLP